MKIITSQSTEDPALLEQCDTAEYLKFLACGIYDLSSNSHTFKCIRNTGECKNYMLQILLSGQGFHTIDGETHILRPGQCILYEPNQPQNFVHYGADNTSYIWIHFFGYGAPKLVEDLNLKGIHSLSTTSGLKKHTMQLARENRSLLPSSAYLCQGYLIQFLVCLSRSFKEYSATNRHSDKIDPALNHMMLEYASSELSNHDYAEMCFLSESRFSHIFKEVTGTTPKRFIEQRRIEAAKELLTNSELSISEIALSVGYPDPYYFSRVFKKNTGMPPQSYLQRHNLTINLKDF